MFPETLAPRRLTAAAASSRRTAAGIAAASAFSRAAQYCPPVRAMAGMPSPKVPIKRISEAAAKRREKAFCRNPAMPPALGHLAPSCAKIASRGTTRAKSSSQT